MQGIAPRVYELKRTIALLQQEKAPISTYYGKLKATWGELQGLNPIPNCKCGCSCGATKKMQTMREEEKVYDFLMGLDETHSTAGKNLVAVEESIINLILEVEIEELPWPSPLIQ
ncbi:hypothetical protein Tsubulata_002361 [Turnera subulata]|uniref:Retrotransposon gag domain-containing protein n=1 Tax=Turnera subulata TaxID=218843 RepID=A0A9Q0JJ18_9ROSI|nr:hypothetical protein Tsubulata_002361 [Turnera subulata]